jgi:two-component system cell cycle sensor histidine kinase/response regulator CckA
MGESGKTILVVDDEPAVLRLVQQILLKGGHTVLVASSAPEGLAIGAYQPPGSIDLLLCDVLLPGMLGPELAAQIKETRPQMRVILMSGETGKALSNGWVFLGKPFLPARLLELVHAELERPSVHGAGR